MTNITAHHNNDDNICLAASRLASTVGSTPKQMKLVFMKSKVQGNASSTTSDSSIFTVVLKHFYRMSLGHCKRFITMKLIHNN